MPRKPSNKARMTDIAAAAGVSSATVSNVLRNKKGMNTETGKRVLRVACELGYEYSAKNRIQHRINFIIYRKLGLVVMDTPFFSELISGIEKACRNQRYELVITYINIGEVDARRQLKEIIAFATVPILLLGTEMDEEDIAPFLQIKVPILVLDSYFRTKAINTVVMDNVEAGLLATRHLIAKGHRSIGCILSSFPFNNMSDRFLGYQIAMKERGFIYDSNHVLYVEPTLEGAYNDMKRILNERITPIPTAFFATNDIIAIGVSRALKQANFKLPEDISLVGMDDMPMCLVVSPTLSTISVSKTELGVLAVNRLIQLQSDRSGSILRILTTVKLIERNSVVNRL
jgi:DNA-binding LacI/PurR family transcriptional regulator